MPASTPPTILTALFRHLLPYDPHGIDLAEIHDVFEAIQDGSGRGRAIRWYLAQMARSLPSSMNNFFYWSILMLRHYFVAAVRNFKRNGLTTMINLAGLAAAVGASIVMFLFIDLQLNMDRFHENLSEIYLVEYEARIGGDFQTWGISPLPLAPAVLASDPDVLNAVRVSTSSAAVRSGDEIYDERVRFVDPEFLNVFSFPPVAGTDSGLRDSNGLVITRSIAEKYFGNEPAVGRELSLSLSNQRIVDLPVTGVTEDVPMNASFRYTILAPITVLSELGVTFTDWSAFTSATFLHLKTAENAQAVLARLQAFTPAIQSANPDRNIVELKIEPLETVPTRGERLEQSPVSSVAPSAWLMFGAISLLVLLVACFNYVNIGIATAIRRSREIGIRKSVGSYRIQLIGQFLGENILLSLAALFLGVLLAQFLFIPWINTTQDGLSFQLNYLDNGLLWTFLAGILLLTGIGAGFYPAFFVSRFQPSTVLRGVTAPTSKRRLARLMLGSQLLFSFLLLAFGSVILHNSNHQQQIGWGYAHEDRLVIPFSDAEILSDFRLAIESRGDIVAIAAATEHIGSGMQPAIFSFEGDEYEGEQLAVGHDYLDVMDVRIAAGRSFDENRATDQESAVVVNRALLRRLDMHDEADAIGRQLTVAGADLTIIGVTEDFYYQEFVFGIEPLLIRLSKPGTERFLAIHAAPGSATALFSELRRQWLALTPALPFKGFFQDDVFNGYFEGLDGSAKIFLFIALIALLISVMGMFGLVLAAIARRGTEIGIRKSLGATSWMIVRFMQKETAIVAATALLIAVPLSYFGLSALLKTLEANSGQGSGVFVLEPVHLLLPVVIILTSTWLTSLAGAWRGSNRKTVDILRDQAH